MKKVSKQQNLVHKYSKRINLSRVHRDKKNDYSRKNKHKGKVAEW